MKRGIVGVSLALAAVVAGCSSGGGDDPRGSTEEALGTCIYRTNEIVPWLITSSCGCPYSGEKLDECQYEQKIMSCFAVAGMVYNCSTRPTLYKATIDGDRTHIYEDLDLTTLRGNCTQLQTFYSCMASTNANGTSSDGIHFSSPPVNAKLMPKCARTPICGLTSTDDVFDPCGAAQCAF